MRKLAVIATFFIAPAMLAQSIDVVVSNVMKEYGGTAAWQKVTTIRETGKVVPTWNYAMVQVRGIARLRSDPGWLGKQIEALTTRHEEGRTPSWAVSDAPRTYIESQLRGIVGVEIEITAIEGKWKVSQNRPEADRIGVADGLSQSNPAMADLVKLYGNI